jgi:hypothetical protein
VVATTASFLVVATDGARSGAPGAEPAALTSVGVRTGRREVGCRRAARGDGTSSTGAPHAVASARANSSSTSRLRRRMIGSPRRPSLPQSAMSISYPMTEESPVAPSGRTDSLASILMELPRRRSSPLSTAVTSLPAGSSVTDDTAAEKPAENRTCATSLTSFPR